LSNANDLSLHWLIDSCSNKGMVSRV
jgi:hypothetical protein